jgi:hypothetical protein
MHFATAKRRRSALARLLIQVNSTDGHKGFHSVPADILQAAEASQHDDN